METTNQKKSQDLTSRDLLALLPGARLRVRVGKRELVVELLRMPRLVAAGKPGLNRVHLPCIDRAHAARIGAYGPKHTAFGSSPFAMLRALHDVAGHNVLEVLS